MKSYRRRQQQKKAQVTIIAAIVAVMLLVLLFAKLTSNTIDGSKDIDKSYYSVEIDSEDTLWSLAVEFANPEFFTINEYIQEVIRINELSSETIYVGQHIIIPVIEDAEYEYVASK